MEAHSHSHHGTLSTLTSWSQSHIRDIFEAPSKEACVEAIEHTFAPDVVASVNGMPLNRVGITQLVLSMRGSSTTGLSVQWENAVEAAHDPRTNRDGFFAGFYIIKGLNKQGPGDDAPCPHERHKSVNVTIKSQSNEPTVDSRRIVQLAFVAVDVKVAPERRAML